MLIIKNYFTIDNLLKKTLFSEYTKECGQLYLRFNANLTRDSNFVCLNYYNFNILINVTKTQNTTYHTLKDDFFNEFSEHKNKMTFCGTLIDDSFTLTEINYKITPKKMGIFVKKRLLNALKSRGIDATIPQNLNNGKSEITRIVVV